MARSLASQLMSSFIMIQSSLFNIVAMQVQRTDEEQRLDYLRNRRKNNKQASKPAKRLARIRPLANIAYRLYMCVYAYEFTRYLLIDIVGLQALQDYHHIDCFLLGRFRFFGRTNKIASRILLTYIVVFALFRYLCMNTTQQFKLYSIEFLLYDHREVLRNELRYESMLLEYKKTSATFGDRHHQNPRLTNRVFFLNRALSNSNNDDDFDNDVRPETMTQKWILRPNRTYSSWHKQAKFFNIVAYLSVLIPILFLTIMYRSTVGSILSNLGFEMSYSTCVSHLQSIQMEALDCYWLKNNRTLEYIIPYANIYVAPEILAHQKRIDEIPAIIPIDWTYIRKITTYNVLRTIVDILENFWLYLDFVLSAMSTLSVMQSASLDIIINAIEIRNRLKVLLEKMLLENNSRQRVEDFMSRLEWDTTISRSDTSVFIDQVRPKFHMRGSMVLEDEILDMQAILADHFSLVQGYNRFVGFCVTLVLSIAFSTSAMMAAWVGSTRSQAVEYEFSLCELIFTLLALYVFSIAALTRSFNYQLFGPITRAMALDKNMTTKLRWSVVMEYYSPIALYCFTLSKSIEISWLFCIKVSESHCNCVRKSINQFEINPLIKSPPASSLHGL